ncbi:hypothetical protein H1P_1450001 [Hyella patelloides LEGE 07179]|uniref:Uncharacterized protein n=1 Tax=Hyella patelloides LEGE 07179 TaxID=945734 RepID=A0A563VM15_9CYAN|nr:hypothetical protein H1P_1450001 [Hyella patelloides LEGE 07179]
MRSIIRLHRIKLLSNSCNQVYSLHKLQLEYQLNTLKDLILSNCFTAITYIFRT